MKKHVGNKWLIKIYIRKIDWIKETSIKFTTKDHSFDLWDQNLLFCSSFFLWLGCIVLAMLSFC
jgi:hypothetical protein